MKIVLIVIARFEFGGIPTQAFLWAKYLKQFSYEPIILAPDTNDVRYCTMLSEQGIRYEEMKLHSPARGIGGTYRYFKSLVRSINTFDAFAILPFNKILGYNINLVWRFTRARKCFFMERNDGREPATSRLGRLVRKIALMSSTAIIFNSDSASRVSQYPRKSFVIKNSFVNPLLQTQEKSQANTPAIEDDAIVLLHVANISRQKNYDLLLDAWKTLRERNPKLRLVIIGGQVREKLPDVMKKMDQPGITYMGSQPNVFAYIARANICLLSTFFEGCPNVVLEYMNFRKVICASDVPALREVLSASNHGLLFRNDSANDLVEKIEAAIHLDRTQAEDMAKQNFEKLMTDYSDKNYGKILNLLEQ